jgi:very-short-patch-repair endonuclease
MINVVSKRCLNDGCLKYPSCNLPNKITPLYCSEHKSENMIDIVSKRCLNNGCLKCPSFNLSNEKTPLYCSEHKLENMIDVKSKKCLNDGCKKRAIFNLPEEKIPLYCSEHKLENMVSTSNKKCLNDRCKKRANFNLPEEKIPLYCFEHKLPNMVNTINKKCQNNKCKNTAIFGFLNKKPQFCIDHKTTDTINLQLENKCSECENEFEHIIENTKYCNNHTPQQYCTIIKRLCKYCDMDNDLTHICKECINTQNKKEWSIVRHLRKNINTPFEYNSSKMLNGCSKKRPDIYFELQKHCLIVEVDENQHNTYQDTCECARINEIVNGIGGKSVIIIRYNPDTIKHKGKVIKILQKEKINTLINTIKEELVKAYETFIVKIIQLYYNDDYIDYKAIKEEDITDKVCI